MAVSQVEVKAEREAYQKLWRTLLNESIRDYLAPRRFAEFWPLFEDERDHYNELTIAARQWIFGGRRGFYSGLSFTDCCDGLQVDPEWLRSRIIKAKNERPTGLSV